MKRYYVPIITVFIILLCTGPLFGGTSYMNDPYPPVELNNKETSGHHYFSHDGSTKAPYKLIYHGDNNEDYSNNTWMVENLELAFLLKWEEDNTWEDSDPTNPPSESDFTINATDAYPDDGDTEYHTGSWQYTVQDGANDYMDLAAEPFYFSIKAGHEKNDGGYNLFQMNTDWSTNDTVHWSTLDAFFDQSEDDLGNKGISHLAFWVNADSQNAVPEPATFLFLGMGLLFLGFVGRRKFSGLEVD